MTQELITPAPALGTRLRIDDATVLVIGQPLDVAKSQPDAANALVHRTGNTLVLVDTGVTTAFRDALLRAVDEVGPWTELVLITTHGHTDHVGNNDIADELGRRPGVRVRHVVPAAELAQMRDPLTYWTTAFARVTGVAPMPVPPQLAAVKTVSMFRPFRPFSARTSALEDLTRERIEIGSQSFTGWTFAGGAVAVLPSQGHCAGHVVVYLRDIRLLHLSDEANGPCAVMPDADQFKLGAVQRAARRMIADGAVDVLTDGHTFRVFDAAAAGPRLDELLSAADRLTEHVRRAVGDADTVDPAPFAREFEAAYTDLGVGGANPSALFLGMMAAKALTDRGFRRSGGRWRRSVSRPRTAGLKVAGAAALGLAALVPWLLRGRNRAR